MSVCIPEGMRNNARLRMRFLPPASSKIFLWTFIIQSDVCYGFGREFASSRVGEYLNQLKYLFLEFCKLFYVIGECLKLLDLHHRIGSLVERKKDWKPQLNVMFCCVSFLVTVVTLASIEGRVKKLRLFQQVLLSLTISVKAFTCNPVANYFLQRKLTSMHLCL